MCDMDPSRVRDSGDKGQKKIVIGGRQVVKGMKPGQGQR
eukprot:CAMPEP_0202964504 /NCGR_PEP_ID=MMETSP1396-20130829/8590_1 /ASSEMBLY_ACC=CAM_ASM_000872 /TAXON_ID= /ORGANISM="Pseudokeronopsis sp., Strain Brazil" /LENGTH=38 /DNA_ID= /DNA_START= /DNA_END= /DNA_ORIENTATION=